MNQVQAVFRRLAVIGMAVALSLSAALAAEVPRIGTDELKNRLGDPDTVILDTRAHGDFDKAAQKIVGAVRVDPRNVESWSGNYDKEQTIIVYCA